MAFRRLIKDKKLWDKYDERINKTENLFRQVKYSLFDSDRALSIGEVEMHGNKLIFEAINQLCAFKMLKIEIESKKRENQEIVIEQYKN
jgi:hypothetical protein